MTDTLTALTFVFATVGLISSTVAIIIGVRLDKLCRRDTCYLCDDGSCEFC